jgi:hypothetical protein
MSPVFAALAGAAVLFWGQSVGAASRSVTSSHSPSPHSVSRAPSPRSGSSHRSSGTHWSGRSGGHYSGGHYSGGHYSGGRHYGGRYYGGRYYGFGYPRFGWGYYGDWGWGWGWGFGPWYPYGYWGNYGYPYGYGYGYRQGYAASRYAAVKTDVEPDEAALYLDGKLIGTADDFDGYPDTLYLGPGHYRLEFRLDGYESYTTDVDASPGRFFRIDHRLKKIPGAKHYGTYEPARPEGGIVRYFEKRRRAGEDETPGSSWRDRRRGDRQEAIVVPDVPSGPDEAAPPDDDWDEGPPPASDEDRPSSGQPVTTQPVRPEAEPSAVPSGDARIVFEVSPPDAAVYVDDHFAGSARELGGLSEGLSVPAGEHRITVTCPGYREATLRVSASASAQGRVKLSLKR